MLKRSRIISAVASEMFHKSESAGRHDPSPRADTDFIYEGGDQAIHGAHPLPLTTIHDSDLTPHISPYLPSPHRPHPYFLEPLPELPHFSATQPILYLQNTMKNPIVVPVFNLEGEVTHTREMDPFIFGFYPNTPLMETNSTYWQVRAQNWNTFTELGRREVWKRSKKPWPNTGTGRYRTKDLKSSCHNDGGRASPQKPWTLTMPSVMPGEWSASNRMMMTLKMLQGRLQIVDRLSLPDPSIDSFVRTCDRMEWDCRHDGAGVMFMDGGSRITPSLEFNRNFFYGSFYNGKVKVVRPVIHSERPVDWNKTGGNQRFYGPKGPKNPIPLNRFNCYDGLVHERLVITEGALAQLEAACHTERLRIAPPHIRAQMAAAGMLDHHTLGDIPPPASTPIELEAAARQEEQEQGIYEGHYDNPYRLWPDEKDASYVVDGVDGWITREVGGKKASWSMLE